MADKDDGLTMIEIFIIIGVLVCFLVSGWLIYKWRHRSHESYYVDGTSLFGRMYNGKPMDTFSIM